MKLTLAERMNLMRFVCSFAWTDLKVTQKERDLVMRITGRLALGEAETKQIEQWLRVPPSEDEVDPTTVPREHRQMFLQVAELVAKIDGPPPPVERDALALFRDLLDH